MNPILLTGIRTGNGEVIITELSSSNAVPEPSSAALFSAGFAGSAGRAAAP